MTGKKTDETYVLAIDQGTTSSRAILFDHAGRIVAVDQKEHAQILPRAGWVEHDATEIWRNVRSVVAGVLSAAEVNRHEIAAVGRHERLRVGGVDRRAEERDAQPDHGAQHDVRQCQRRVAAQRAHDLIRLHMCSP